MPADRETLIARERQFWQSMVDHDTDTALGLLSDPAFMVGPHGSLKFDHAGYRRMAEHGSMVLTSYELGTIDVSPCGDDAAILSYEVRQVVTPRGGGEPVAQRMHDTSTWVRAGGTWRCAMHTESPVTPG